MSAAALETTGQIRAEVDRLGAELTEIDEWEAQWSTGARKSRIAQLNKQLQLAAHEEKARIASLRAELKEVDTALEAQYAKLVDDIATANTTGANVQALRDTASRLRREARRLDMKVPPQPARLSQRAVKDGGKIRNLLYGLRSWASADI